MGDEEGMLLRLSRLRYDLMYLLWALASNGIRSRGLQCLPTSRPLPTPVILPFQALQRFNPL